MLARAIAWIFYKTQEFGSQRIRSRGGKSPHLEAALAFYRSNAQEVQHELAQDGEILSGIIGASSHLVVAKDDIHTALRAVLDAPGAADGVSRALRVAGTKLLT